MLFHLATLGGPPAKFSVFLMGEERCTTLHRSKYRKLLVKFHLISAEP